jgi:hypothetical protein
MMRPAQLESSHLRRVRRRACELPAAADPLSSQSSWLGVRRRLRSTLLCFLAQLHCILPGVLRPPTPASFSSGVASRCCLLNLHIASFSESCQGVKSRFPHTKEAVECFESKRNQGALQTPDSRLQARNLSLVVPQSCQSLPPCYSCQGTPQPGLTLTANRSVLTWQGGGSGSSSL